MAEKATVATAAGLDFTNVKDGGGSFNKKRQPEGDYRARVLKVVDAPSKKDGVAQWLFTIQVGTGTYPYYCKHEENQLWKVRNLLIAAGIAVPKKRVKVDPNRIVGKDIAVTLEDDEYEGKMQSNISATFPLSELSAEDDEDTEGGDEDDTSDDDEDEASKPKKKAPVQEEEEDDDDETTADALAALDRTELKALIASEELEVKVFKSMTDDDIRAAIQKAQKAAAPDEEEEDDTPPAPKKSKKAAPVDDDDLDEIDIDDA